MLIQFPIIQFYLYLLPSPTLRHPRKPINPQRAQNIDYSKNNRDTPIPPAIRIVNPQSAQQPIHIRNGTELTILPSCWVEQITSRIREI